MRFSKIKSAKQGVELQWETVSGAVKTSTDLQSPDEPRKEFTDAMQAFVPFVMDLLDLPDSWREGLEITTLSISEEKKESRRGLIVTCVRRVDKANDRTVLINTPYMRERFDEDKGEKGYLSAKDMLHLEEAEAEAQRYLGGERAQPTLFPETAAADPVAAAKAKSEAAPVEKPARKRRPAKTGAAFVPGAGEVVNADATEAPTDEALRSMLLASGRDVPLDAIGRWSSSERDAAQRWADNAFSTPDDMPACIQRDATLPLASPDGSDGWLTPPAPVHLTDDDVQEIKAAVEHGASEFDTDAGDLY